MSNPSPSPFVLECITRYEKLFVDDWIENLDWSTEDAAINSFAKGRKLIVEFSDFCFVRIGKSLLCGEYIVDRNKFNLVNKSFEKYWTQEHLCPDGIDENINKHKRRLWSLYELLDNHIRALFNAYATFVVSVDEKLEYGRHDYLFKIDTIEAQPTREFRPFLIIRKLIIPLCNIEHHLAYEDEIREEVVAYIEQIDFLCKIIIDPESLSILKLAKHKATFILKKLIRPGDSFEILVDCDKKIISREMLPQLPDKMNKFIYQYECVHENRPYSETDMAECQMRVHDYSRSFIDMALLMHYYCSTDKAIQQIDNLLKQFDSKYKKLFQKKFRSKFDNHALCTLRNFMYNCRLSYKVKHSYSTTELQKDIDEIEALQGATLVCNFYPYKKAIEYLISVIQQNVEQRNLKFDYDSNIELLEFYLKKFDSNIEWCESHKFYPIQLPFNECIVEVDNCKLILPSTATRPIDYKKLREAQISFHNSLEFFRTSQIYLKDKKDIQDVKEEIKNIEKRYLEIGGILIGIVTFLLSTINIFTDKEASLPYMFQSILGMGLILGLFACLIIIVIENYWNTPTNKTRVTFCSIIAGVYLLIAAVSAFQPYIQNHNIGDSKSTNQISSDSIKISQDTIQQLSHR